MKFCQCGMEATQRLQCPGGVISWGKGGLVGDWPHLRHRNYPQSCLSASCWDHRQVLTRGWTGITIATYHTFFFSSSWNVNHTSRRGGQVFVFDQQWHVIFWNRWVYNRRDWGRDGWWHHSFCLISLPFVSPETMAQKQNKFSHFNRDGFEDCTSIQNSV